MIKLVILKAWPLIYLDQKIVPVYFFFKMSIQQIPGTAGIHVSCPYTIFLKYPFMI